jgi:hypothetical protein
MAGQTDQPQTGITPVPDLIERYRVRRDAWIAQADELARLRDEVRGSAEREAMEIVTAARRDVRKVIMEARRELLVLSAQVQAALGEATAKTDPATLLTKAGITPDHEGQGALPAAVEAFVPEDAVNEILNEVQDDMTALAEDARSLPLQAVPQVRQIAPPPPPPSPPPTFFPSSFDAPAATGAAAKTPPPIAPTPSARPTLATPLIATPPSRQPAPQPEPSPLSEFPEAIEIPELNFPELRESVEGVPLSSQFPSEAVPVQSGRRLSAFVAAFVGVGIVVAGVTFWWLSSRNSGTSQAVAENGKPAPTAAMPSPQPGPADSASPAPLPSAGVRGVSIVAEAVRDVWVRTTVDGQSDDGRTLAAGQVIDVSAEKSISLRAGDGGAILFSLNRGQKQPLGRSGQPITRQFTAEKASAPVPAPAPEPAKPAPTAPTTNTRTAPPIAQAVPAPAPPIPIPAPSASLSAPPPANPPAPPLPAPATPPANSAASNNAQPAVPPGVVNQLSAPANSSAPVAVSPANAVVAIARQWLDAYHRQDRAAMAALSTENLLLADERRPDERFPPGLSDVTRALDRVSVQIAADTAVLTAVMTEQSGSQPSSPHVSPISQVWVLGGGQWKVRQARFVSEARLNQVFR